MRSHPCGGAPDRAQELVLSARRFEPEYLAGSLSVGQPHALYRSRATAPRRAVCLRAYCPGMDGAREDLRNYFYRGMSAFVFAAKAFGDDKLSAKICAVVRWLEREFGDLILSPSRG